VAVAVFNGPAPPAMSAYASLVPPPPTSVTPTWVGDGTVRVTWTMPPGLPPNSVTGYTVQPSGGADAAAQDFDEGTDRVVTDLTNGAPYTFDVTASNPFGTSTATTSVAVTPLRVPDAPTGLSASVIDADSVLVTWTALTPPADGGDPPDVYVVTATPAGVTSPPVPHPTATWTFDGLPAGVPQVFRVHAHDVVGNGIVSPPTAAVTPGTPPSAPTGVVAALTSSTSARVYWRQPEDLGGNPVTTYDITVVPDVVPPPSPVAGWQVHADVTELAPGIPYTISVRATTLPTWSSSWVAAAPVTPAGPPAEPAITQVVRDNGAVRVEWAPGGDGGSPITGFQSAAGTGVSGTTLAAGEPDSRWLTGLTNGTTYDGFSVVAVNRMGAGAAATTSLVAKPARQPDRPVAQPGLVNPPGRPDITCPADAPCAADDDSRATVYWRAPSDTGGEPILDYEITCIPDCGARVVPHQTTNPDHSAVVDRLPNGIEHVFIVRARNAEGLGAISLESNPVTPATCPDPVRYVAATVDGNKKLRLTWQKPSFDGGAKLIQYWISWTDLTAPASYGPEPWPKTSTSRVFKNLIPCHEYEFTVTAENRKCQSPLRTSPPTKPATVPEAPDQVLALAANAQATVTFWAPTPQPDDLGDGCSPLLSYTVRAVPGDVDPIEVTHVPGSSIYQVTFGPATGRILANGQAYTFRVKATNAIGDGPEGASDEVTPCGQPYPPLAVAAEVSGDGAFHVTWLPPAWDGGCVVEEYQVSTIPWATGQPVPVPATPPLEATLTGLVPGTSYVVEVRARNSTLVWSAPGQAEALIAATCPDAPTSLAAYPGDGVVTICWDGPDPDADPGSDGYGEITSYTATIDPPVHPPITVAEDTTCVLFDGLVNGTDYRFQVTATNAACTGLASAWTDLVQPGLPALEELVVLPAPPEYVEGGQTATAWVRLSRAAPSPSGSPVTLWSETPSVAQVPPSGVVVVPPGALGATFTITTTNPAGPAEDVTIHASLSGVEKLDDLRVSPPVNPCVVRLCSPTEAVVITDYSQVETDVTGVVDCPSLQGEWEVNACLPGRPDAECVTIATGSTQVPTCGPLGHLDPTLLLNGTYELRLEATNIAMETSTTSRAVILDGNQKVGHFSLSFVDLTLPVEGLPIQLVRTYDSRDTRDGDFGHGWQLSLRDVRLEKNRPIGEDWVHANYTMPIFPWTPQYCVEETAKHRVTVTLPTGKVYQFEPTVRVHRRVARNCQLSEISLGYVHYTPVGTTRGSLRAVTATDPWGNGQLFDEVAANTGSGTLQESGSFDVYDPMLFELTVEDGTVYRIRSADALGAPAPGLLFARDRVGNKVEVHDDRVVTFDADGLELRRATIVRDLATGRITSITDPNGQSMTYAYTAGNLAEYRDRVQVARGATGVPVAYDYEHPTLPHHLTRVIDPENHRPVRSVYAADGRLEKVCDGYGFDLTSNPDAEGRCIDVSARDLTFRTQTIRDRKGRDTVLQYDLRGNVLFRTGPDGKTWGYTYHGDDQVASETKPAVSPVTERVVTTYGQDPNGHVASVRVALGTEEETTSFTWTARGDLLALQPPLGPPSTNEYTTKGLLRVERDPMGHPTSYTYQSGRLTVITDALGNKTTFTHAGGQVATETVRPDPADPTGVTTYYVRDANGNVKYQWRQRGTQRLDGSGYRYEWDENDRLVQTWLPDTTWDPDPTLEPPWADNPKTLTEYDGVGNRVAEHPAFAGAAPDPLRATFYSFNQLNELETVTHPTKLPTEAYEETHAYDANGNRVRTTVHTETADGIVHERITNRCFDEMDRLHLTWWGPSPDPTAPSFTCAASVLETAGVAYELQEHDEAGRLRLRRDANGNEWTYEHDMADRQWLVTDPNTDTTETSFDANGRMRWVRDGRGNHVTYQHDDAGRTRRVCRTGASPDPDPPPEPTPEGTSCTTFGHDDVGRLVSQVDGEGHATTYGHDGVGRLAWVVDARAKTTRYEHDDLGNMSAQVDALLRRTTYEHDVLGRRTGRVLPLGQAPGTGYHEIFAHDPVTGFMTARTPFGGGPDTTYEPEANTDRVAAIHWPSPLLPAAQDVVYTYWPDGTRRQVEDPSGTTDSTYDPDRGWLERVDFEDGTFIEYGHDGAGNVTSIETPVATTTLTPDALNRLWKVYDPAFGPDPLTDVVVYTFDAAGNLDLMTLRNGVVADYAWDDDNQLDILSWTAADGTNIATFDYTRDDAGHITDVIETGEIGARNVTYSHDALYRLTGEEYVESPGTPEEERWRITYAYDDVGNRLTRRVEDWDPATSLWVEREEVVSSHDANDRLLTAGTRELTWDADGRLDRETDGADVTDPGWGDADQLLSVTTPEGVVLDFTYDADGIRQSRTRNSVATRFLVDANRPHAQVLEERDASGTVRVRYVYGHRILAQVRDGVLRWLVHDHLGSVRALLDTDGNVTDRRRYEAFGTPLPGTGDTECSVGFTGEQWDNDTELLYLRARWMAPDTGEWHSGDRLEGTSRLPQSLHRHVYANASPVDNADPTGLTSVATVGTGLAVSGQIRLTHTVANAPRYAGAVRTAVVVAAVATATAMTIDMVFRSSKVRETLETERVKIRRTQSRRQRLPKLVVIPRSIMPNIADHIIFVQGSQPTTRELTRATSAQAILNRAKVLARRSWAAGPGLSWDEYPFASSREGGGPSVSVRAVPARENLIQGGWIGACYFLEEIAPGQRYTVLVTP
jgi:RHS repeat-associated protein